MPPRIPNSTIRCLPSPTKCNPATIPLLRQTTHAQWLSSSNYATVAKLPPSLYKHKIAKILAQAAPDVSNNQEKIYPPTQPLSFKAPTSQKTLLLRLYHSLLRSSPLTIVFQHNAVRAPEWIALRRELASLLAKVDAGVTEEKQKIAKYISITNVNKEVFGVALRIADSSSPERGIWEYGPLLSGPLGVVTFPALSPAHITATMGLLFPDKLTAKKGFDPAATAALAKLILLGARVQERPVGKGRAMDSAGIKWLSGLKSVEEMRGEIVAVLQSVGGGEIVRALESVAISLGRTVEGRRKMLEEEAGGPQEAKPEA